MQLYFVYINEYMIHLYPDLFGSLHAKVLRQALSF